MYKKLLWDMNPCHNQAVPLFLDLLHMYWILEFSSYHLKEGALQKCDGSVTDSGARTGSTIYSPLARGIVQPKGVSLISTMQDIYHKQDNGKVKKNVDKWIIVCVKESACSCMYVFMCIYMW